MPVTAKPATIEFADVCPACLGEKKICAPVTKQGLAYDFGKKIDAAEDALAGANDIESMVAFIRKSLEANKV